VISDAFGSSARTTTSAIVGLPTVANTADLSTLISAATATMNQASAAGDQTQFSLYLRSINTLLADPQIAALPQPPAVREALQNSALDSVLTLASSGVTSVEFVNNNAQSASQICASDPSISDATYCRCIEAARALANVSLSSSLVNGESATALFDLLSGSLGLSANRSCATNDTLTELSSQLSDVVDQVFFTKIQNLAPGQPPVQVSSQFINVTMYATDASSLVGVTRAIVNSTAKPDSSSTFEFPDLGINGQIGIIYASLPASTYKQIEPQM